MSIARIRSVLTLGLAALLVAACASTGESAGRGSLVADVGIYPPPPGGITRPRVGVPQFTVSGANASANMNTLAADQLSTLMVNTQRFRVVERAQLDKLLDEQKLAGVVKDAELAASGEIQGIDYLLLGKVTNFRIKTSKTGSGFGLANVAGVFGLGDVQKEDVEISTDCGVDLRLVDPVSGEVVAARFSEFNRTDTASALGVQILGVRANADADLKINEGDHGKILRLALDDALKKMLPDVDTMLIRQADEAAAAAEG